MTDPQATDRALRLANYAEELRIIAAEFNTRTNRRALLRIAAEYDALAVKAAMMAASKERLEQQP